MGTVFRSFGEFVPGKSVTNDELALRYGISEEWIRERTGILERRYFEDGATSDMIVSAARQCLDRAGLQPEAIDCIIVATMTPDYACPSTAAVVHRKLGTSNAWGFDIMAACSGFVYALELASALLQTGKYQTILVAGADKLSSVIDPADRKTTLILADGAGVCLVARSENENHLVDTSCRLDSAYLDDVIIPNGGSARPLREDTFAENEHYLRFNSKLIFENGVQLFIAAIRQILEKNDLSVSDIDRFVLHQANKRILEEVAKRISVPVDRFVMIVEHIGNTSAASIPIALSELSRQNELRGKILIAAIGAGFTYGSSILNFGS